MVSREEAEKIIEPVEKKENKLAQAVNIFAKDYISMAGDFFETQPYFYDKYKIWWLWNHKESRWEIRDEVDLMNELRDLAPPFFNLTKGDVWNEIQRSMKLVGRKKKPKEISKLWIQLKDKIYDLETDKIFDSSAEYFNVNPIPWSMGETDETPNMDRIFKEWVGEEYVETLYEIIAYCMLPNYPIHRMFMLVGSGLNGKSKYLDLIQKFIGKDNLCSSELDMLTSGKNRFESAKMYKKLVCMMGETSFAVMKDTQLLKKISGEDMIRFEFKNKDGFDDYNYAKILIATNSLPATSDKTVGFYRRTQIIDFPNQFTEKKDILSEIPEQEYSNLATKSIKLLKKILDRRAFTNEGSIDEREQRYEERSNPLLIFIKSHCYEDPNGFIGSTDFIMKANSFLKSKGYRVMDWQKDMLPYLGSIGHDRGKQYVDGVQIRGIVGLNLKQKIQVPQEIEVNKTPETPETPNQTRSIHGKLVQNHVLDVLDVLQTGKSQTSIEINILENTPEFCDATEKSYGPFKPGDKCEVPQEIGVILIKKGKAEEIKKTSVNKLIDYLQVKKEVDWEQATQETGVENKVIEKMISEGTLFEPKPGRLMLVK